VDAVKISKGKKKRNREQQDDENAEDDRVRENEKV